MGCPVLGSTKVGVTVLAATPFGALIGAVVVVTTFPLLLAAGLLKAGETPANRDAPGGNSRVVTVPSLTL